MQTAKTDQTGRILRLIWVFAGPTDHFVGFVVLRLESVQELHSTKISVTMKIWASSWENLLLPYVNNKCADQPAHLRSLISIFVVRCLDSLIPPFSVFEISRLCLVPVAAQAGLSLTWSQTRKTGFLVTRLIINQVSLLWPTDINPKFSDRLVKQCRTRSDGSWKSSLIRMYTVYNAIYIFCTYFSMVKIYG